MTRPTPCQKCKTALEKARENHAAAVATLQQEIARQRDQIAAFDAKCLANANSYDELRAKVRELEDPLREQTWAERFRVLTERAEAAEQKLADVRAWLDAPFRDEGERMFVELREILAGQPAATQSNGAPPCAPTTGAAGKPATAESSMPVPAPVVPIAAQPAAPSLPAVGPKWRSLAWRPGSVWIVKEVNDINVVLVADGPESATRICARHLFTKRYEPAAPDPKAAAESAAEAGATAQRTSPPTDGSDAGRSDGEHVDGCRYEQEIPAIDPEDCPRCCVVPVRAATCCEYHRTGGSPSNPCREAVAW